MNGNTTRCGSYFGTTLEAVQCFTYQTRWKVRTCKKETTYFVLGCVGVWVCGCVGVWVCGRKNFFSLSPSYKQSTKNREKSPCLKVLELGWVISTWWDENMILFVFSAFYEIYWDWFCGRKQMKNAKVKRGSICFAKGALIGKSIFRTQRINAVHGRCFSSGFLRHIPSKFTLSVRRRIVL